MLVVVFMCAGMGGGENLFGRNELRVFLGVKLGTEATEALGTCHDVGVNMNVRRIGHRP